MGNDRVQRDFAEHRPALRAFLRKMTGDPALAEDLCQEVLFRAIRAADRYEERGRTRAWLFAIARRLYSDDRRRRARRPEDDGLDESRPVALRPRQHLAASIGQALGRIADERREAFLLREIGGLGYREIAATLDITADAARSRIHRARLELREMLAAPLARTRRRAVGERES